MRAVCRTGTEPSGIFGENIELGLGLCRGCEIYSGFIDRAGRLRQAWDEFWVYEGRFCLDAHLSVSYLLDTLVVNLALFAYSPLVGDGNRPVSSPNTIDFPPIFFSNGILLYGPDFGR